MRAIQAQINCHDRSMHSPYLQRPVPLNLSPRGLFLVDLNQIMSAAKCPGPPTLTEVAVETFVSEPTETNKGSMGSSARSDEHAHPTLGEDEAEGIGQVPISKEIKLNNQENDISRIFRAVTGQSLRPAYSSTPEDPLPSVGKEGSERYHQAQTTSVQSTCFRSSGAVINHVADPSSSPDAGSPAGRHGGDRRPQPDEPRRPGLGTDPLWSETSGRDLPHGLAGSGMGLIHGVPISDQQKSQLIVVSFGS